MNISPKFLLVIAVSTAFNLYAVSSPPASGKIDEILARDWQKRGLTANPAAPDEVFLRRIYLDVVGRIPTSDEAKAFLSSNAPDKRAKLIDALLASDGFVSNYYNYFADLLRLQTDVKGQLTGMAYSQWLKAALAKNQPYDAMVRELLTTDGASWDSGAIGFYMRDQGMPLDHLAATVQVFLGTRIECAQCHNHPFDKWTQMDYYKMAGFTYGMDTKTYGIDFKKAGKSAKAGKKGKMSPEQREDLAAVRQSMQEVMKPLRYMMITEGDNLPKLPHDYKYDDAKPNETVSPKTMFGHDAVVKEGQTRLDAFADWMTDPQNPRFTTVIANRLWKKVMGLGVIEPVDELTDSSAPVNGELLTHLEQTMVANKYDLRAYLKVLFNSEVYQRMPTTKEVTLGDAYYFTGPVMRRMTAEQVWDSSVTLMRGDVDAEVREPNVGIEGRLASLEHLYDMLTSRTMDEMVAAVKSSRTGETEKREAEIKRLTAEMSAARQAGDKDKVREFSAAVARLRKGDRETAFTAILGKTGADEVMDMMKGAGKTKAQKKTKDTIQVSFNAAEEMKKLRAEGLDKAEIRKRIDALKKQAGRGAGQLSAAVRASELPSPAPRGHFLRTFGQSDRETIENATREAAVPQALNLLNGPIANSLLNPATPFMKSVEAAASPAEKIDSIYLALLSRKATADEQKLLQGVMAERGDRAIEDITHSLLNTSSFLFVQ
ncbi:MAG: DUF1549 domain-containing protein [Verrucomicrobiales bacterium]|nr:DUF1549 domain-containing protein [Verrucomicrobiales bacterium]MCP5558433.1 DUF1549 domain-containing protein [Verrucomicrobiaceae bacterium]